MRFGCYSLEMIQHGCQSCTASPTHNADAHILHAVNAGYPACARGLLHACCASCFWVCVARENKRKENATPSSVNSMRSQELYRAAQALLQNVHDQYCSNSCHAVNCMLLRTTVFDAGQTAVIKLHTLQSMPPLAIHSSWR